MSESDYSDQDYDSSEESKKNRQNGRDRARRIERISIDPPSSSGRARSSGSRCVNVCNVPYNCEWKDLKEVFKKEVGNVTFVETVKEGNFNIEFESEDLAAIALKKMHRYEFRGRNIVVKQISGLSNRRSDSTSSRGNSLGSRLGRQGGGGGGGGGAYVYVCNIPYECQPHHLKTHFRSKVGDVVSVDFVKEGCAFVHFKNSESAMRAIDIMNKFEINGRQIVVREEAPRGIQPPSKRSMANPYPSINLPMNRGSSLMGDPGYNDRSSMMGGGYMNSSMGAFSESSSVMAGHQSLLGPVPVPERSPFNHSSVGASPAFGGLPTNNYQSNLSRPSQGLMGHAQPFSDSFNEPPRQSLGHANKIGNTYGLSLDFLESKGINGPLVRKVFVANIDYKVDSDSLKELFSIAGTVTDVELKRDDEGKSRGFGFVDFEHPVEAVQAISMLHEQMYFDRKLSVQMAKASQIEELRGKKEDDRRTKLPRGLQSVGIGLGARGTVMKDITKVISGN